MGCHQSTTASVAQAHTPPCSFDNHQRGVPTDHLSCRLNLFKIAAHCSQCGHGCGELTRDQLLRKHAGVKEEYGTGRQWREIMYVKELPMIVLL